MQSQEAAAWLRIMKKLLTPIILLVIATLACGGTSEPRPTSTPFPTRTPVPEPDASYSALSAEEYGTASERGYKIWVEVEEIVSTTTLERIATYEASRHSQYDEITVFFYLQRNPEDDGNWTADMIFEGTGTRMRRINW